MSRKFCEFCQVTRNGECFPFYYINPLFTDFLSVIFHSGITEISLNKKVYYKKIFVSFMTEFSVILCC